MSRSNLFNLFRDSEPDKGTEASSNRVSDSLFLGEKASVILESFRPWDLNAVLQYIGSFVLNLCNLTVTLRNTKKDK